jgi:3',5'-cyclic AMP phosphodiesterase CpdA
MYILNYMRKRIEIILFFLTIFVVFCSGFSALGLKISNNGTKPAHLKASFYFVQITDTHVTHKDFDQYEVYKQNFQKVLQEINSFREKPAFVAITGDLVEWGGSGNSGEKNYEALLSCLYNQDGQLYVDEEYKIPLYTTPGNHDYMWETKLDNYYNKLKEVNKYVVHIGPASFYFIDSGANYILEPWDWARVMGSGLYNEDIDWLENQFNGGVSTSRRIVLMHHPAVNSRDDFGVMESCIARNRERFVNLCLENNVDLVLTGHTHRSIVYDSEENVYNNFPLSCDYNPTLFVQTDDCKEGVHYRNITFSCDDVILHETVAIAFEPTNRQKTRLYPILFRILKTKTISNLLA